MAFTCAHVFRPSARALRRLAGAALVAAACATALPPAAWATTPFGAAHTVQGQPLVLQGAGTRYRAIFKVYDMALYLPRKVQSEKEALALSGPVRLSFVALRDLPGTDLGVTFIRGLSNNATPDQIRRHTPSSNRLVEIFSGRNKLLAGDTFAMEFVPGKGTTFYIQGEAQGAPVGDDEYFGMILRIWLGNSPADHQLKTALLSLG
jgi:hypothetical protein